MPNKIQKFSEVDSFSNCSSYYYRNLSQKHPFAGQWRNAYFKNSNAIAVEVGCGYGEYTTQQALLNGEMNFMGMDLKGNRIWTGAKFAIEKDLSNVAFIRTRADYIHNCFGEGEVDEIWLTFPDPQPGKGRVKKRLTHQLFIDRYKQVLRKGGRIHLKTDNEMFFEYSLQTMVENQFVISEQVWDLYTDGREDLQFLRDIKTRYETKFLGKGEKIKYASFEYR